jgi:hypothetical protein
VHFRRHRHPSGGSAEAQGGVAERRAQPVARFHIDSDPRRLRSTLDGVNESLADLESQTRRKVRQLAAELIAHSVEGCERPFALELDVFPSTVRLELVGLAEPSRAVERRGLYVHGLADRWGVDRRAEAAAWFEVDRPR